MRLSICIATLNRCEYLNATLRSIVDQITPDVEIVIVDGASTDDTAKVVESFQNEVGCVRYVRLLGKGGIDRDYALTVEYATGDYCWLFSDDDVFLPKAIPTVLAKLRADLDLLVVNAELRSADLKEQLKAAALDIHVDRLYKPGAFTELFSDAVSYMSFIGCIVIRRSLWLERDKQRFFGSWFVHLGVIFQAPLPSNAEIVSKPCIAIRYGNATWSSRSFEISLFKWPELIWSFQDIDYDARSKIVVREPWRNPLRLLIFRARGAYGPQEYQHYLSERLSGKAAMAIAWIISRLPGAVVNAALLCYFSTIAHMQVNAKLHLVDLRSSRFYYRKMVSALLLVRSLK